MVNPWALRLSRAYAVVRGLMLILFMVLLVVAPEKALPGSSVEPARSLALMFVSRTLLLGGSMIFLAFRGRFVGLGFILLADASLQVFDVGLSVAMGKGSMAVFPLALGVLDVWAGLTLLRNRSETSVAERRGIG